MNQQKLLIKIDSQGIKIKYMIRDPNQTFDELKANLVTRFQKMGQSMDLQTMKLTDENQFEYMGDDIAMDYLSQNEVVMLLPQQDTEPKPQLKEQKMDEEMEAQNQPDQQMDIEPEQNTLDFDP